MGLLLRGFVGAVKTELRRPASAVACVGGFVAALAFSLGGSSSSARGAASLIGGMLAVAALGELPFGLLDNARRRPAESAVWAAARSLFPFAGVAAAAGAIALMQLAGIDARPAAGPGFSPATQAGGVEVILLAILAAACTQAVVQAAGGRGSEPASAALLVAVGAAGAASAGLTFPWLAAGWAIGGCAAGRLAAITYAGQRLGVPRGRGRTVWLWPLPAQGRLRPAMTAAAMLAALVAMAAWLVSQPPMVDRYAVVATMLFIALAVPQMTLADGIVDRREWTAVLRPRSRSPLTAVGWPPAGRIAVAHAAMFAWPLVVAGVLTARLPGTAVASASAAVLLVLLAAVAIGIALPMRRSGGLAEAAQATMLALFAVCCAWCGGRTDGFLRVFSGLPP